MIVDGNRVSVTAHSRRKPEKKPDPLWLEWVGNVLAMDLEWALSEPLDDPQFDDLSDAEKARLRESIG